MYLRFQKSCLFLPHIPWQLYNHTDPMGYAYKSVRLCLYISKPAHSHPLFQKSPLRLLFVQKKKIWFLIWRSPRKEPPQEADPVPSAPILHQLRFFSVSLPVFQIRFYPFVHILSVYSSCFSLPSGSATIIGIPAFSYALTIFGSIWESVIIPVSLSSGAVTIGVRIENLVWSARR